MSILEELRRKRNGKSLNYYQSIINREQSNTIQEERVFDSIKTSRSFDIKVINDNKRKLGDKVVKSRAELKRKMETPKLDDTIKNNRIVQNNTLSSLISGFLDSKNKKKYIKDNRVSFKNLDPVQQRTLFKLYIKYL